MKTKRFALIPLTVLLFASALLTGCNKESAPGADQKKENPETQQLRQQKTSGD
jgi:predicted small secreted protein